MFVLQVKNSFKFVNLFMGIMHYFFTVKCALKHHTKLSINSEQKRYNVIGNFLLKLFLIENTFRSLNQATSKRSKYHRAVKTTSPYVQIKKEAKVEIFILGFTEEPSLAPVPPCLVHTVSFGTRVFWVVIFFIHRTWWWLTLSLLGYWNLWFHSGYFPIYQTVLDIIV